ncbi:hypothetical protein AaE_004344 [Aphanomyces astaci]|uniref:Metallo-beta-lactamase domain-containing protein n=2 Tax=Aphanomyces astaci TaxID=112090 RepID=A0A6A5ASK0_APHAT|nr:hypothetical protein AaE_004344 [Aphanomyces astaci]
MLTTVATVAAAATGGIAVALYVFGHHIHLAASKVDAIVRLRALATSWMVRLSGTSSSLSKLDVVAQLAPNVIRVLGLNPGRMTLQGTNTYIVGTGKQRILIDTGDGSKAYMELLVATMHRFDIDGFSDILLTHGHFDHVGGCWALQKAFPKAKMWKLLTYTSTATAPACECSAHVSNSFVHDQFHMHDLHALSVSNESIQTEGAAIGVLRTPGHTNDHVCFTLRGDDTNQVAIFTGDCVLGEGTCTFQNLSEYMASLELLKSQDPATLYPGHGPVLDNAIEAIDMYISHRRKREDEIVAFLTSLHTNGATPAQIVSKLYPGLPYALTIPAKRNVQLHLNKLVGDGKVFPAPSGSYQITKAL